MAIFGLLAGYPVKQELKHSEGIHKSLLCRVMTGVFQSSILFLPLATVSPGTPELLLKSSRTSLSRLETQTPLHKTELLWPKD